MPLQAGQELRLRGKSPAVDFIARRGGDARPISVMSDATEIVETDFEDASDDESSPKESWESDSRRRSQTTLSSFDELPTPSPRTSTHRGHFELRLQPVEGPKGPHLFRSSQASSIGLDLDYAMQMSPLLPKEMSFRADTAFTEDTLQALIERDTFRQCDPDFQDPEAQIRSWSTQQVIDWMFETGIDSSVIECFDVHDINGAVLLDLQFDDLKELDIQSFGKRHQLWNAICLLRGDEVRPVSPQPTPFQDISRPCTSENRESPSRTRQPFYKDSELVPTTSSGAKKRRGRKAPKAEDFITPAESVSIVAIEQLLPKPHKCTRGEDCGKWRKQQRELQRLHDEHGIRSFPISPTKGGHIFVAGDPGNAMTADNMIPNVHKQASLTVEDPFRPLSEAQPSVIASSGLLSPAQLPEFALHEDSLHQLGTRDPQDNVKQFLTFQHVQTHAVEYAPPSSPLEMFPSTSISPFPAQYPISGSASHDQQLRSLPRLEIPRSKSTDLHPPSAIHSPPTARPETQRSASAVPQLYGLRSPETAYRSATASPGANMIHRLDTPASEMDVPLTAFPIDSIPRDMSQSVPPSMHFRNQSQLPPRTQSRIDWRRPSITLPPLREDEVLLASSDDWSQTSGRPSFSTTKSTESSGFSSRSSTIRDPAHHSPTTRQFGYGEDCTQSGWMKKRKTKMLRHEWQDAHFRLKGTQLTQHANARLSAAAMDSIDVDDYAVAVSSMASGNKLAAAMKALNIKTDAAKKKDAEADATAFAFQLIPAPGEDRKRVVMSGKTHHFAVKTKDDRIGWMREIMIAKALQQKAKGYDVEINGLQA